MAIVKSIDEIKHLIPTSNALPYMSMITHTPEKVLLTSNICAVEVDAKECKIITMYRAAFSLFAGPGASYLFVRDATKDLTTSSPYIKANNDDAKIPGKEDWNFINDEIGLHIKTGIFGNKLIYFTTNRLDVKEIRDLLKKKYNKKTVVVETVYV